MQRTLYKHFDTDVKKYFLCCFSYLFYPDSVCQAWEASSIHDHLFAEIQLWLCQMWAIQRDGTPPFPLHHQPTAVLWTGSCPQPWSWLDLSWLVGLLVCLHFRFMLTPRCLEKLPYCVFLSYRPMERNVITLTSCFLWLSIRVAAMAVITTFISGTLTSLATGSHQ